MCQEDDVETWKNVKKNKMDNQKRKERKAKR